jgi:hypothetical protein
VTVHYLLHSNIFTLSRIIMLFEINKLNKIWNNLYHSFISVSFPNNNKSIFTGIPIKFNLFISNNIIIRDKVNMLLCNK